MGQFLAVCSLLLFSTNVMVVRVATPRLAQQAGFFLALGTNLVVSGAVVVIGLAVSRDALSWNTSAAVRFALAGLLATYLARRLFFRSVLTIGSARATTLQITNPLFSAVLGWTVLGQRARPLQLAEVLVVIAGLYLSTRPTRGTSAPLATADAELEPPGAELQPPDPAVSASRPRRVEVGLALGAALAYAAGNALRGSAVRSWDQPALGALIAAFTATVAYLVVHRPVAGVRLALRNPDRSGLWLWVLSGALTILGQITLIGATRHLPLAVAVAITSALPVVVLPVSFFAFHNSERIDVRTAVGSAVVLAGVIMLVLT